MSEQSYRTSQEVVINTYEPVVDWQLPGETEEPRRKSCSSAIPSTTNPWRSHPELNRRLRDEKRQPDRLRYAWTVYVTLNLACMYAKTDQGLNDYQEKAKGKFII
jgi:hypothetical protein